LQLAGRTKLLTSAVLAAENRLKTEER